MIITIRGASYTWAVWIGLEGKPSTKPNLSVFYFLKPYRIAHVLKLNRKEPLQFGSVMIFFFFVFILFSQKMAVQLYIYIIGSVLFGLNGLIVQSNLKPNRTERFEGNMNSEQIDLL